MTLCHVFRLDLFSVTGSVFNDTQDCLVTRLVIHVCSLRKWKLRNRFFHYYRKKKRRDWQRMKQRCHRHCVFNVSCMIQMAAFQFSDGNSTLAFTAVCSLTLWAGYLHEAKLSQTTVSPNHWTSRILYNKSWLNWINVLLLLAFCSLTLFTKVKVQMKGSAK